MGRGSSGGRFRLRSTGTCSARTSCRLSASPSRQSHRASLFFDLANRKPVHCSHSPEVPPSNTARVVALLLIFGRLLLMLVSSVCWCGCLIALTRSLAGGGPCQRLARSVRRHRLHSVVPGVALGAHPFRSHRAPLEPPSQERRDGVLSRGLGHVMTIPGTPEHKLINARTAFRLGLSSLVGTHRRI